MQLYEEERPSNWSQVVGQDKAIAQIDALRSRGLAGRAYWITGQSGTGKTTIARLIAAEVADSWATEEIDAGELTVDKLRQLADCYRGRPISGKGWAIIINEAHGLRADQVRRLLVALESIPPFVAWIFTTTCDGHDRLFADLDDAHPLLSRCQPIALTRQGLAKPFATRLAEIARTRGLGNPTVEECYKLVQSQKNNFRGSLQALEAGAFR